MIIYQLNPAARNLEITVNDGTDAISGATVTIGTDSETTGDDGKCTFELDDGTYDISVTKTGYADGSSSVTINGSDTTKTISLTIVDTISFTINDGENPIQGATVVIGETTKTTGTSGGCTFPNMAYDTYSATISATGYATATESIEFDAEHKSFTISLESATTEGEGSG